MTSVSLLTTSTPHLRAAAFDVRERYPITPSGEKQARTNKEKAT